MLTIQISYSFCLVCTVSLSCMLDYSMASAQSYPNNVGVNPSMFHKGPNSFPNPDLETSASGYGGYGGGYSKGSLIGGFLGDITGNLLRQILHSLTGIGIRLGVNLNNEFYNVPEYGYEHNRGAGYGHNRRGHGHNGGGYVRDDQGHRGYPSGNHYANGYSNIQETVANDRNQKLRTNNYQHLLHGYSNNQQTVADSYEKNQRIYNNNYQNLLHEHNLSQENGNKKIQGDSKNF